MVGSNYTFDHIDYLDYHFNKTTLTRASSFVPLPKILSKQKSIINPKNTNDNACFVYAIIARLNHKKISNNPQRTSNIKKFSKKYNWTSINVPADPGEYKTFEKYNDNIALNIFRYVDEKKEIRPVFISKNNKTRSYHPNLLMISNEEEGAIWHYTAITSIPALLRGITSKHNGADYCLNCFSSSRTAKKLAEHQQLCNSNDFCLVKMPKEKNKFISSTPGKNTLKNPFTIYADIECILKPIITCDNSMDNSFINKTSKHVPSGYSMLVSHAYDKKLNTESVYSGKDCMDVFCYHLNKKVNTIINIPQKPLAPLTEQKIIDFNNAKECFICNKEFTDTDKKCRDHDHYTIKYRGPAHNSCNLMYKVPKSIPIVFHNGSRYDFHLILNPLAKHFDGPFSCLGENTEKYITFSTFKFKKTSNAKKCITYQMKFIDSFRHMGQLLSNLVDNFAKPGKNLINRFYNTNQLCDNDINKFELLLRKGVYPYEYMDSWLKFKHPVPLDKKLYYSKLNDEDISDGDIEHVKKVCDAFKITNLKDYHDLYVKTDVSLLADVLENYRYPSLEVDKLDPAHYLSAPGLSCHFCMKKTGITLELLTDENMLLLIENDTRGGMCNVVKRYAKANNKYMKNYNSTKKSSYLIYLDFNNLYGWAMTKKLPIDSFKWEEDLSTLTPGFIKNCNKNSDIGYLFYVDSTYPNRLREKYRDLPFLPDRMSVNKVNKLICSEYDKTNYVVHILLFKTWFNT